MQENHVRSRKKKISFIITVWLVVIVAASCAASAVLSYLALSKRYEKQTEALVRQKVEEFSYCIVTQLVNDYFGDIVYNFLSEENITTARIDDPDDLSARLQMLSQTTHAEYNVVNSDGIIVASSVPEHIGYDMHSGEQSSKFLVLLDGTTEECFQGPQGISYDESVRMIYSGKRFPDGSGFVQVGFVKEEYYSTVNYIAEYFTNDRRIGESGYFMVCDEDQTILNSFHAEHTGETLTDAGIAIDPGRDYSYESMKYPVFGVPSYVNINYEEGIYFLGIYPVSEAYANINALMSVTILIEFIVFAVLFVVLVLLLKLLVVNNMIKVNAALSKITDGRLDEKIEVRGTYEFDALSTDINSMVDRLKEYIAEATARIDAELAVAKDIQTSAVPNTFPPFPGHTEFELFASMEAAKEVGGDFYDFYMIGRDTLGFLIADVSGKSIPGAMFMMRGKSVIKSLAESGMPPADVFSIANEKLCEGNEAELFITAWMGYLDLHTGVVRVANAGHNPPVLIRNGKAEYVILKPGLMLAGMEGMIYKEQTLELQKGDILFLFTDGVTEAMDAGENLYGEERLLSLLSFGDNYPEPLGENGIAGAVCELVATDIAGFVRGAEQSDDITMLCIRYLGA